LFTSRTLPAMLAATSARRPASGVAASAPAGSAASARDAASSAPAEASGAIASASAEATAASSGAGVASGAGAAASGGTVPASRSRFVVWGQADRSRTVTVPRGRARMRLLISLAVGAAIRRPTAGAARSSGGLAVPDRDRGAGTTRPTVNGRLEEAKVAAASGPAEPSHRPASVTAFTGGARRAPEKRRNYSVI
jgi:hypothetical protein